MGLVSCSGTAKLQSKLELQRRVDWETDGCYLRQALRYFMVCGTENYATGVNGDGAGLTFRINFYKRRRMWTQDR
jgi:hypothetical protein